MSIWAAALVHKRRHMTILNDIQIAVRRVDDVVQMLQQWLASIDNVDQGKEHFIAIHLNTRMRVMRVEVLSIGIVNAAPVYGGPNVKHNFWTSFPCGCLPSPG